MQRQEVGEASDIGMMEYVEKPKQQDEEQSAHTDYVVAHRPVYDEGIAVAGLVLHDTLRRRQRCKSHGGKGVHNQVDPKHLSHGKRRLGAHERSTQHNEAGHDIYRHLEQDETLYVVVKRATPHHGPSDACKGVVDNCYVAGLLGHRGAVAHRQSHLRGL